MNASAWMPCGCATELRAVGNRAQKDSVYMLVLSQSCLIAISKTRRYSFDTAHAISAA